MFLHVRLNDGSFVSLSDVNTITRVDPFKTFVVNGIIFDYALVESVSYLNDDAPRGQQVIYIFEDGGFVSARYDIMKYIQPIRDQEGVVYRV